MFPYSMTRCPNSVSSSRIAHISKLLYNRERETFEDVSIGRTDFAQLSISDGHSNLHHMGCHWRTDHSLRCPIHLIPTSFHVYYAVAPAYGVSLAV